MVQQPRQDQPQYVCIIPVDSITGNQDEEIVTFGISADDAKNQAQKLLADNYGCNDSEIHLLIQQARIEPLPLRGVPPALAKDSGCHYYSSRTYGST